MSEPASPSERMLIHWPSLVESCDAVPLNEPLESVHHLFEARGIQFLAVLDGRRAVGLCVREEIAMKLGSAYGFSLFHKLPVSQCLVENPLVVCVNEPWTDVLQRVFAPGADRFHVDVLLVDAGSAFLGLIPVASLIRLQTRMLMETIAALEQTQAEISRRNAQMTEDLRTARELQIAMFSPSLSQTVAVRRGSGGLRIASRYAPIGQVSGDFFEILTLSESVVAVVIADVMGHGIQAGLITAMLRALIQTHCAWAGEPGEFLTLLNRSFCEILDSSRLEIFATAFMLVIDSHTGTIGYAAAGHPAPVLLSMYARESEFLDCSGNVNGGALGIASNARYEAAWRPIHSNDVVLLFTDGLFEVESGDNLTLGVAGIRELASAYLGSTVEQAVDGLIESARACSNAGCFADDVCIVGLQLISPDTK